MVAEMSRFITFRLPVRRLPTPWGRSTRPYAMSWRRSMVCRSTGRRRGRPMPSWWRWRRWRRTVTSGRRWIVTPRGRDTRCEEPTGQQRTKATKKSTPVHGNSFCPLSLIISWHEDSIKSTYFRRNPPSTLNLLISDDACRRYILAVFSLPWNHSYTFQKFAKRRFVSSPAR